MSINIPQLREWVVRPTLQHLKLHSPAAENLVVGTALTESRGVYIRQLGSGPALGLWQMEPATHDDIWDNYLGYENRSAVADLVSQYVVEQPGGAEQMVGNLYYACAMCRIHYRRKSDPLPSASDAQGMAEYWKKHYNTEQGAGSVSEALVYFQQACEEG